MWSEIATKLELRYCDADTADWIWLSVCQPFLSGLEPATHIRDPQSLVWKRGDIKREGMEGLPYSGKDT